MYVNREKLLKSTVRAHCNVLIHARIEQSIYNYMESSYYRSLEQQAGILGETIHVSLNDVKQLSLLHFKTLTGRVVYGVI